jgi:hypothetical protein
MRPLAETEAFHADRVDLDCSRLACQPGGKRARAGSVRTLCRPPPGERELDHETMELSSDPCSAIVVAAAISTRHGCARTHWRARTRTRTPAIDPTLELRADTEPEPG